MFLVLFLFGNTAHAALPNANTVTSGLHLTSFEIDGDLDNDSTFTGSASGVSGDWEDSPESDLPGAGFYANGPTPADGAAGLNADTTGIYYSKRNVDKAGCNGDTDDDIIPSDPGSNVKVDDGPNWPVAIGNVPGKDDLEDVWVALETVRLQTATVDQVHHIAYIAFERCSGTGGAMSAILFFENGDGVLPSDGPGTVGNPAFPFTDLLFEFDVSGTGSASNDITQYERNLTNDGWINPSPVSDTFWDIASNGNNPTFGEIAIDLTAAGIIPEDQCVNLQITGSAATIAGGSIASDPKDIVIIEPVTIQNCAPLQVNKVSNPSGINVAEQFTYVVDQLDGLATHGTLQNNATVDLDVTGNSVATSEPDADLSEFDQVILIGETHDWVNVIAEPDYQIDETILPVSGDWLLENIVCSWYDPFAAVLHTDEEVHDGTSITGQFIVPSPGFNNGQISTCTITNITDALDYGDATDTYHGGVLADAPAHFIIPNLKLGTAITDKDDPTAIVFGVSADADDNDGDDEDSLAPLQQYQPLGGITCTGSNGSYTTSANEYCAVITVTNNTLLAAQVVAWLDYNADGVFSVTERSQTSAGSAHPDDDGTFATGNVPSMSAAKDYVVVWTSLGDIDMQTSNQTNMRIRVTSDQNSGFFSDASPQPIGGAGNGEIEDHLVAFDILPVTLSSIASEFFGRKVKIDWNTSSELFNVGFQLWGLDATDSKWKKLHNWLVQSGSGNAVESQSYSKTIRIPASIKDLAALGISSVDSDGSEHYYGPFDPGQSYGNLSQLEPIAWDHIRNQVDVQMAARGYVKGNEDGYRKVSSEAATSVGALATETVVEFKVRESGVYRVTARELLGAGIDWRKASMEDIALLDYTGKAVARHVTARGSGSGKAKTLGANGEIYFYAQGLDEQASLYTDTRVYRLLVDHNRALRNQFQGSQGLNSGFSEFYMETSRVENDFQYELTSATDDPWVDAVVVSYPDRTSSYAAGIPVEDDVLWSQPSLMRLELARSSGLREVDVDGDDIQDAEHLVEGVILNSQSIDGLMSLGTQHEVGKGDWQVEFEVPGDTPLSFFSGKVVVGGIFSAGLGYMMSEVHVDAASFSYARPYVAKQGDEYLTFRAPNNGELGYEVAVPDTGQPVVFAYNDAGALARIEIESQTRMTKADGSRQRLVRLARLAAASADNTAYQYWVSGNRGFLSVESLSSKIIKSKSTLLSEAVGSNYLMIAYPMFMGATLEGYASFKQNQDHRVSVVDYLEVVDTFGGGQPGTHGLTAYLRQAEAQGNIDYVLLIGGSSYDHTDKLGNGAFTYIPGHYGKSNYSKFTVSDVPYITNENNDLISSIGRFPVRSELELQSIIDKSIAYSSVDHRAGTALLIAEHTVVNENINFGAALDDISQQLPGSMSTTRVYVDDVAKANNLNLPEKLSQALTLSRAQIISELNKAPDVVLFNGHGTTRQLSNNGLFTTGHVSQITAQGGEIWVPMSCYVTYFESSHRNTLAHELMFNGNAVNISGATLLSNQSGNITAGKSILDSLLNKNQTIGNALNSHKIKQDDDSLNINWALLGDPTQMISPQ